MTKAFKRIFAFVAGVCVMLGVMQTPLISKAESVQYTSVSEDLGKDILPIISQPFAKLFIFTA